MLLKILHVHVLMWSLNYNKNISVNFIILNVHKQLNINYFNKTNFIEINKFSIPSSCYMY